MMHKQWIWAIACVLCGIAGCSLDNVVERGNPCPGVDDSTGKSLQYIVKDRSECNTPEECKCISPEDCPKYADSFELNICPANIPTCHQTSDDNYYCMIACPSGQAACDGKCIQGSLDPLHCGARGECYSNDEDSPHYKGEICKPNEECRDSKCIGATCESNVWCDKKCTNPDKDEHHCGALGECNSPNEKDNNYMGADCIKQLGDNAVCQSGKCVCKDNYMIIDGKCAKPSVPESCDDNHSENICGENAFCDNGKCRCRDGFVNVDALCVDPNSNDHCGATEGIEGNKCTENEQCIDKQCTCLNDYAKCDDKCIDGNTDNSHCGAKGLCISADINDINYRGVQCSNGETCSAGICQKSGGCNTPNVCPSICSNNKNQCGPDCIDCYEDNVDDATCKEGKCLIYTCKQGYHLNEDKTHCVKNQDHACARVDSEKTVDCTIKNGERICDDSGSCKLISCKENTHEYTDDYGETCEDDTEFNCGSHGTQCHNTDEEPEGMTCINRTCYVQECTQLTNTLPCPKDEMVCRQTPNEDTYSCQIITTEQHPCFYDGSGSPIYCNRSRYTSEGATGRCVYDTDKADPNNRGWTPKGWTCECKSTKAKFYWTNSKYTCK